MSDTPVLLDLFCCEGGATEGYRQAGFDVIGVDSEPQPRYTARFGINRFHQADAMTYPLTGLPYIVENVATADLPGALVLCGTEFGLKTSDRWLKRHRRFHSNVLLMGAGGCHCAKRKIGGVYGQTGNRTQPTRGEYKFLAEESKAAMRIDWMSRHGITQALPPEYTRFLGEQLMDVVTGRRPA